MLGSVPNVHRGYTRYAGKGGKFGRGSGAVSGHFRVDMEQIVLVLQIVRPGEGPRWGQQNVVASLIGGSPQFVPLTPLLPRLAE